MLKSLQTAHFWPKSADFTLRWPNWTGETATNTGPVYVLEHTPTVPGRLTSRATWALIGSLIALVGALALCLDRFHNGDFYLSLMSGRFIAQHGFVTHDPFSTISQGGTWLNEQWLSELAFFRVSQVLGPTGLTVIYAVLITLPLALLLWLCRNKGWPMLIAVAAFYFPGLLAVIHPRAAGFTVVIFSLLVAVLLLAWRQRGGADAARPRTWWAPPAILALFALWANLHGGFIAGFLLLGLATVGLAIDHWRGLPDALPLSRVAALGLVSVLAAVIVTISTPLGSAIWSYLLSFQNQAISLASTEWQSAFGSPGAVIYLTLAASFAAWMWVRSPRPRRATTLLVTAGFLIFAGYSIRNIVFIGPIMALQVAWTAPNRSHASLRMPIVLVGTAATAAATIAAVLGPPRDDPTLGFPVADYAIAHPPKHGRIVTYAGAGLLHQLALPEHAGRGERLARAIHAAGAPRQLRDPEGLDRRPARRASPDTRRGRDHPRALGDQRAGGDGLQGRVHLGGRDLSGPRTR